MLEYPIDCKEFAQAHQAEVSDCEVMAMLEFLVLHFGRDAIDPYFKRSQITLCVRRVSEYAIDGVSGNNDFVTAYRIRANQFQRGKCEARDYRTATSVVEDGADIIV